MAARGIAHLLQLIKLLSELKLDWKGSVSLIVQARKARTFYPVVLTLNGQYSSRFISSLWEMLAHLASCLLQEVYKHRGDRGNLEKCTVWQKETDLPQHDVFFKVMTIHYVILKIHTPRDAWQLLRISHSIICLRSMLQRWSVQKHVVP